MSSANAPRVATTVLGAGAWGTALAILLARSGQPTSLWGRNPEQMAALAREGCNQRYLPGIKLPPTLLPSSQLDVVVRVARDILIAVPSAAFRSTLQAIKPHLHSSSRLIWATKGFESASCKLLHEVVVEECGVTYPSAVISGPTFAAEVARGLPTAVTIASHSEAFASELADRLHSDCFRAYTSDDIVGVEVGGAVKNVLAIAAGISDGLGFGANARAALISRGLAEVMRLGIALGGRPETFMGLAGLGDLVLTCTDDQSRNRRFGLALGQGLDVDRARANIDQVVEGINAAGEVSALARKLQIDMPIVEQVDQVISHHLSPHDAVSRLLQRELKTES